jgi:hypothetical protein
MPSWVQGSPCRPSSKSDPAGAHAPVISLGARFANHSGHFAEIESPNGPHGHFPSPLAAEPADRGILVGLERGLDERGPHSLGNARSLVLVPRRLLQGFLFGSGVAEA